MLYTIHVHDEHVQNVQNVQELQHDLHKFETGVKFCQKIAKNREHLVSFNGLQIKLHMFNTIYTQSHDGVTVVLGTSLCLYTIFYRKFFSSTFWPLFATVYTVISVLTAALGMLLQHSSNCTMSSILVRVGFTSFPT